MYLKDYVFLETKYLNVKVLNMIAKFNESRSLLKHISCSCRCRLDGEKCNSNQKCSNDKCRCECNIMNETACM